MKSFVKYMATMNGRIIRIVIGALLVVLGLFGNLNQTLGIILMIVGLIPLGAGIFDVCLIAPLTGMPVDGKKIRAG